MASYSLDLELSSSQYAYCNDNANVSVTSDISIEAWIKLEQLPSTAGSIFGIVCKWDPTAVNDRSYMFVIHSSDELYFYASDDGTYTAGHTVVYKSTTAITDIATWIHVAVTFDISAEACKFYFNGTEENGTQIFGTTIGATIDDNVCPFSVGANKYSGGAGKYFDGKIDDVRLWNDIRTQAEIDGNKCIELTGSEGNLAGYWRLNNDYTDGANSSDLTGVNSPVFSTDIPNCITTTTSSSSSSTSTTSSSSSSSSTSTTSTSTSTTSSSSSSTSTTTTSSSTSTTVPFTRKPTISVDSIVKKPTINTNEFDNKAHSRTMEIDKPTIEVINE